jgi:glycosyltransferase involved in cell wall biosynthesis
MRLGIDAREIERGVYTGIGQPLNDFLKCFARAENEDACVLFSTKPLPVDYGPRIKNIVIPEKVRVYWDQVQLSKAIQREHIDLFYSPYYKVPLLATCKIVSAILDLMYIFYGPYGRALRPWERLYYAAAGRMYVRKADKILTCSEHSKKDIVQFYGVAPEKIKVIPLNISCRYRVETDQAKIKDARARFKIDGPYILYMGNFKPHKNVKGIIEAFARVARAFPDLRLVLAGPLEHTYPQLNAGVRELGLGPKVIFTGKLTESDQPHLLYAGAELFVFPSFYEGFGLPPVEAMACGTPVVASNVTSVPEVVKDAGLLVDPHSIDQIAGGIKAILGDRGLRDRLVEKGLARAREYEEAKIAQMNYDFLREVWRGR